jgi:hypothetical protein
MYLEKELMSMWFWAISGGLAWVAGDALFGMAMAAFGIELAIIAGTFVIFLAIFAGWIKDDYWPASHANWILESIVPFLAAGLSAGLVASWYEVEFFIGLMLATAVALVSWFFLWVLCAILGVGGGAQEETLARTLHASSADQLDGPFFYHHVVFGGTAMGWAFVNMVWVGIVVALVRSSKGDVVPLPPRQETHSEHHARRNREKFDRERTHWY